MFTERIGNWKIILTVFGIFGFVLSFITGLIGGVSFGVIFLRALLFAVLFDGISLLIMFLIDTFIPELVTMDLASDDSEIPEAEENLSEGTSLNGGKLDILIEDEDDESTANSMDIAGDMEEVEEAEAAEEAEEVEELTEAGTVDISPKPESVKTENLSDSESEDMPDIGTFADGFEPADSGGSSEGLSSIDGMGSSQSVEILGDMHDTQELVKAVQTVLKKDQEG